jgi:hypothetical protein
MSDAAADVPAPVVSFKAHPFYTVATQVLLHSFFIGLLYFLVLAHVLFSARFYRT